ncbi:MAG TPA: GntR family transcriptional regulator, partial [Acidimicrobiia bacterium]|nr:GntR family transcriptional regulator [Acidimicrobiia bacterium]
MSETDSRAASAALRLYKIDASRAHEEVVGQIVYAIRAGILRSGDRLPTSEELAESTGVSKPVVGEAVRVLREHGVVASKRGVQGGVTVITDDVPTDLLPARGWRKAHLTELVEARRPIEMMLSLLAAERA